MVRSRCQIEIPAASSERAERFARRIAPLPRRGALSALEGLSTPMALLDWQTRVMWVSKAWSQRAQDDSPVGAHYQEVAARADGPGSAYSLSVEAALNDVLTGSADCRDLIYMPWPCGEGQRFRLEIRSASNPAAVVVRHISLDRRQVQLSMPEPRDSRPSGGRVDARSRRSSDRSPRADRSGTHRQRVHQARAMNTAHAVTLPLTRSPLTTCPWRALRQPRQGSRD